MNAIKFNGDGEDTDISSDLYHLDGVVSDYTLCGITLDGDTKTAGSFECLPLKNITCPQCIQIIKHCKKAKIKM